MITQVAIVKEPSYSNVKTSIIKCLEHIGGIQRFVKKGDVVLIKPNLCDPFEAEKGVTTHPLFIKAVAELVQEQGASVWVGEQAAGNFRNRTKECLDICGVSSILDPTIAIHNLQEQEFSAVAILKGSVLKKIDIAEAALRADVIINLPKLKTHFKTYITGAIKNMFGCTSFETRTNTHKLDDKDFSKALVDIYSAIMPQLTIVDGIVCLDARGHDRPLGPPKQYGLIVAGEDGVAVDAVLAELTGHGALSIPPTKYAHQKNIGCGSIKEIEVLGTSLDEARINNFIKHPLYSDKCQTKRCFKEVDIIPFINKDKCKKCTVCIQSCPVKAISQDFIIDENQCIKCYCCEEVCIYGGIEIKKTYNDPDKQGKIKELTLNKLKEFKAAKGNNLIAIALKDNELNKEAGKQIETFLCSLQEKKIDFRIVRPLPPCIFGLSYMKIFAKYNLPTNCSECLQLFRVQDNKVFFCNGTKGPELSELKDENELSQFFKDNEKDKKLLDNCKGCRYLVRNLCSFIRCPE